MLDEDAPAPNLQEYRVFASSLRGASLMIFVYFQSLSEGSMCARADARSTLP